MTQAFPGGVRDAEGRQAYVSGPTGETVAIDLTNGEILWRKSVGQPIAVAAGCLLILGRDRNRFVLHLLDTRTGSEIRRIIRFGMPDWADQVSPSPQTLHLDAFEEPSGIRLSWRVRRLYRGGAPPPPEIAAAAREEHASAILIDPKTGRFRSVAMSAAAASGPELPAAGRAASPSDAIATGQVGDRVFALRHQSGPGGQTEIIIEARDAASGNTIWQTAIAKVEAARPPPLRQ